MYRGSTPTNTFTSKLDLSTADVVYITYTQDNVVIVEKNKSDCTFGEGTVSVTLSQQDTLKFSVRAVEIQIRARFADSRAVVSNIIQTTADRVLKDGVI